MPFPTAIQDLYVTNGWYIDLPGLVSPHFETLEGLQKVSNDVSTVDAGTNRTYSFSDQIDDFGEMTLGRTEQGTPDDKVLAIMVEAMRKQGVKVNAVAYKLHHQQIAFTILFEGFRFRSVQYPTFDVNGTEKFIIQYAAKCDNWIRI